MIGLVLDRRYQIIEVLAKGGFGQTFLAKDIKRPGSPICVVKQLKPSFSNPELLNKARELFNREAETLQILGENSQIPRLLAYFEENQEFYLIQEYITGKTLDQELIPGQSVTEIQGVEIVKQLLEILAFVHSHKVIHRDIKPSNIIRREADHKLVLIDFGAVKKITTEVGQKTIIIGTPGYMPIEQLNGNPNFTSDIYAVGMIGIQALTGANPQPNNSSKISMLLQSAKVSNSVAKVLTKMVSANYQERYQSAIEALQTIQNFETTINPITLIAPGSFPKTSKLSTKILGYSAFIIVILVTAFLSVKVWQNRTSSVELPLNGKWVKTYLDSKDVCEILLEDIYCHKYIFPGTAGQKLTIEMKSNDFDPYLVLRTPDGNKLAVNSDISPGNWNAKIVVNLPANGNYLVMARTSSAGESGSYSIRAKIE